jgi:hypothetical protein
MKIHERLVDSRGHTLGYLVGNRWCSRKETAALATEGKIEGVCVRRGSRDERYLAGLPSAGVRLSQIPVRRQPANKPKLYARPLKRHLQQHTHPAITHIPIVT